MQTETNIVAASDQSTVVARYKRPAVAEEQSYQSEAQLEQWLISQLEQQGIPYADIHDEKELTANLRLQLEQLNNIRFTDAEWNRFFTAEIANNRTITEKTYAIHHDSLRVMRRDDGSDQNIHLVDRLNPLRNSVQVINQYRAEGGRHPNRYDVTVLVNGFPMVHIELKRRGVALREAFNQINRYGRDSFYAGAALYEYVQLFVISNGTQTKYYSNTTRQAQTENTRERTGCSYTFTSYWADATNQPLTDLEDFARTFFQRNTLLNLLLRYMVLTVDSKLLAMRPYQITATEQILGRIERAHNAKQWGTRDAGGYIWHTTGSGKTLTSYKTAVLATEKAYISKVLFVVDRKDLDYQTMREFNRFQKDAVNGNTSTAALTRRLEEPKSRIIVTTIQKLTQFVKKNDKHPVYNEEVVIVFDECHRSQFGEMHRQITRRFKRYYIFGFTGTPIFKENTANPFNTTDNIFGTCLHSYTIIDAIRDRNVLPFRIEYYNTMREKSDIEKEMVWSIERDEALLDPRRISLVAEHILATFDRQTKRAASYSYTTLKNIAAVAGARKGAKVEQQKAGTTLNGFNAMFAVQSIPFAQAYYEEIKRQNELRPEQERLRVATIFSYQPNEADPDDDTAALDGENSATTEGLDLSQRDFLDSAISDYNRMFGTSYSTDDRMFENYYKDVSLRMKNRELDLLIVVNMFLTGFDAPTLNTIWIDKTLRSHGLIQTFSRTNRILNSVKSFGNIICFRNLEEATNRALVLFGNETAHSLAIIRPFNDYFLGYEENGRHVKGFIDYYRRLDSTLKPGELPHGEQAEKEFINLWGIILKMLNLLDNFDEFAAKNPLTERHIQDYTSVYLDLYDKYKTQETIGDGTEINDDLVFEIELIKQVEVNIDYILFLIEQYVKNADAELRLKIEKTIRSAPELRDKEELILRFLDSLNEQSVVTDEWATYVNQEKRKAFDRIVEEEQLPREQALDYIEHCFDQGTIIETGPALNNLIPVNPFNKEERRQARAKLIEKLKEFFRRFFSIADKSFAAD